MPIHSKTNLYPGINAHLNSFLQQEGGGWESFHAEHIIDLRRVLAKTLPAGYYAVAEKSLLLVADPDDEVVGIVVYRQEIGQLPGQPVTRIELLSSANKPPGDGYRQYKSKRQQTLESGVALVEIDFLHETPPANPLIPDYTRRIANAYPYNVTVDIPEPTPIDGKVEHYGIGVDEPLLTFRIPLLGQDYASLDLQEAYRRTVESGSFFDLLIDYAADPPNFERYREDDRAKISALLANIRRERGGQDAWRAVLYCPTN
jgi:hypothetical protein